MTWSSASPSAGVTLGARAPDFTLVDLRGDPVRLSDFRGTPVVLNFWATWCPPCKEEMPLFERARGEVNANAAVGSPSKVVFLLVNLNEGADAVQEFLTRNGVDLLVALDATREQQRVLGEPLDSTTDVFRTYRVFGLPTTFFVDADGIIQSQKTGQVFESDLAQHLATIGVTWSP